MRIKMKRIKPEEDASPYQFIRPTVLTDKAELNKQQTFGGCKQVRGGGQFRLLERVTSKTAASEQ